MSRIETGGANGGVRVIVYSMMMPLGRMGGKTVMKMEEEEIASRSGSSTPSGTEGEKEQALYRKALSSSLF